jgi:uncharacterized Zn-binding protein involved in type VI secretion
MVTGVVPHVGGPIGVGSPTVKIGGLPAARVGDLATCIGPPDVIADGEPTVVIEHKQAARVGSATAHGGLIVAGCGTVIIGSSGQADALRKAAQDATPMCETCRGR